MPADLKESRRADFQHPNRLAAFGDTLPAATAA